MSIYAVNGKAPIAAWIPSLDTAGNGTTTLTDLVGANDGTLTNMDAATDWVADTDSGGVRALDFDGVNDHVLASAITGVSSLAVSVWCRPRNLRNANLVGQSPINTQFNFFATPTQIYIRGSGVSPTLAVTQALSTTAWNHVCATIEGTAAKVYLDGTLIGTGSVVALSLSPSGSIDIGAFSDLAGFYFNGIIDDIRIFDQALDATDVSALYAAGLGRGITFGGTVQTRRRRSLGGYGL